MSILCCLDSPWIFFLGDTVSLVFQGGGLVSPILMIRRLEDSCWSDCLETRSKWTPRTFLESSMAPSVSAVPGLTLSPNKIRARKMKGTWIRMWNNKIYFKDGYKYGQYVLCTVFNGNGASCRVDTKNKWGFFGASRPMPSNPVDGRSATALDGCWPSRLPSVWLVKLSLNGTGTATVLRDRLCRTIRSRCAALYFSSGFLGCQRKSSILPVYGRVICRDLVNLKTWAKSSYDSDHTILYIYIVNTVICTICICIS